MLGVLAEEAVEHRAVNKRGAHGIDPDARLGIRHSCRLGEPDHAMRAGGQGRARGRPSQPEDGSHIHNAPAPLGQHLADLCPHTRPHPGEIERQHALPRVFRHVQPRGSAISHAGVVAGAVETPPGRSNVREPCLDHCRAGHIGSDRVCHTAGSHDQTDSLFHATFVHIRDDHGRPCPGKRQGDNASDTCCAPGDQCNPSR